MGKRRWAGRQEVTASTPWWQGSTGLPWSSSWLLVISWSAGWGPPATHRPLLAWPPCGGPRSASGQPTSSPMPPQRVGAAGHRHSRRRAGVAARIEESTDRLDHMIVELRRHVFALGPDQSNPPRSSGGKDNRCGGRTVCSARSAQTSRLLGALSPPVNGPRSTSAGWRPTPVRPGPRSRLHDLALNVRRGTPGDSGRPQRLQPPRRSRPAPWRPCGRRGRPGGRSTRQRPRG